MPRATASKATAEDVLAVARSAFARGERLDVQALAASLGINRATLYRWFGHRDRLLGDVLWSFVSEGFASARAAAVGTGAERIADAGERYFATVMAFSPVRRFIAQEPEAALRVLVGPRGHLEERVVDVVEALIREEVDAGRFASRLTPRDLAYALVRVAESFLYADLLTGGEPDAAKATAVLRALVGL